jgi:small subunit ribosomal protein S2
MSTQSTQTLIERLFSAGAHFGFKKSRRHPTVTPYLFTSKDGNDIIDLEKTAGALKSAALFLEESAKNGKTILFVSTKDETSRLVTAQAVQAGMPFVTNRWIGGMLTNFSEIKKRIARLDSLISERDSGELERKYTKKERVMINREVAKLEFNFAGIKTTTRPADVLVIVDPRHDAIALAEARDMGIPVVGLMSSDCDVSKVTHAVVINDSLQGSLEIALAELVSAVNSGKAAYVPRPAAPRPTVAAADTRTRRPRRTA